MPFFARKVQNADAGFYHAALLGANKIRLQETVLTIVIRGQSSF